MGDEAERFGAWQPWQPREVAQLFSGLAAPWWIAGGWALDLFLSEQTRAHADIDVQVLRRDQGAVRALFDGWDVQEAHPIPGADGWPFREWKTGTTLSAGVHDVWCRPTATAPWALQLMVGDSRDDVWLFRRDARITRPLTTIGRRTVAGMPYLAPEIQLLYKAKAPRPKDEVDFKRVLPHFEHESRQWLVQSLAVVHPGHPWLGML